MEREIKFEICIRRKDGSIEPYIETLTLDELIYRNGVLFNSNIYEVAYKRQFIGLQDKTGRDIYEGAILQVANNVIYEIRYLLEDSDGEKMSCFGMVNNKMGVKFPLDDYAIENGKVIGNVYENPELLK